MEQNQQQNNPFSNLPQKENPWGNQQDDLTKTVAELVSSVRILEDRYINLRKKSQITDQNLIEIQKEFFKEKKHLDQELIDAKLKLQELTEELKLMLGELKDTVKQKDLVVLNKYLDLWEPMQFVTRKEIENLLKNK